MTNTAIHTPAEWEATPYGEHWSFAYNLANKEREEYDFTVEFHESIDAPEENAVISLIEAAPLLLAALEDAERFISGFENDECQEGMNERLARMRAVIAKATDHCLPSEPSGADPQTRRHRLCDPSHESASSGEGDSQ